uniref:(northern house mosquito) hypothetical protein n=1 Tax=Culex pipiens TaxID=7175 RepID=A0A8D8JRU0_CULPI
MSKMSCFLLEDLPEMHVAATDAGFKLKLYRFPQDPADRKQWYTAIKRFMRNGRPCQPREFNQLCSLHFKPSDFIGSDLIEGSIPCVFSPLSTADLWKLNRKRAQARCCVPSCDTSAHYNLYPFVPSHDATEARLARKRYQLWLRTLQVAPCRTRPEVWICRRHFVYGFPAKLSDFLDVDWVPTLHLEGIPPNPCRECSIVLENLPAQEDRDRAPNLNAPFCRLCLKQNVPLQSMFLDSSAGQRLAELIRQFVNITVDLRHDSDSSVCIECLEKLAQMEEMVQVRARWNANNKLLARLRENNNQLEETAIKEDSHIQEMNSLPVVSIPMDTLFNSIFDPPKEETLPYEDFKQDLEQHNPADISQDCLVVDPPAIETIDLTEIDERERLIRQAMRSLRKQLKPRKRKRSKTSQNTSSEPPRRKPCRNTRIG